MSEEEFLAKLSPERLHKELHRYHISNPDLRTALANAAVKSLGSAGSWALLNTYLHILPRFTKVVRNPETGEVGLTISEEEINKAIEEERKNGGEEFKFYAKASESIKPRASDYLVFSLYEEILKTILVMTQGYRNINIRLLNLVSPPNINLTARLGEEGGAVPYISGRMEIGGGEPQQRKPPPLAAGEEQAERKLSYRDLFKRRGMRE